MLSFFSKFDSKLSPSLQNKTIHILYKYDVLLNYLLYLILIFLYYISAYLFLFLGVIFFTAARTNPKIVFNNYRYKIHLKRSNKTYWKCERPLCKSRLVSYQNTVQVNTEGHNHMPIENCIGLASQIVNIRRMCSRNRTW